MSDIFGFLFFERILISIIVIVVNFVNKNHNKTIIKEKNLINNRLNKNLTNKKLYQDRLITKKVLEEKQNELLLIK